ncbi:uncharacterized protein LOC131667202 [Phymastichus coffea]|uniref:uncharacterized protein LOC131667202 n=1 Tax=Phymastichus coffea TaxID=108790 RepID=UPI00273B972B|nr:uncharacterized protein LOC131667202 [Phymastichus coffea]
MPKYAESHETDDNSLSSKSSQTELTFDLIVHPPTSLGSRGSHNNRKVNPYALFLNKPRRMAVIWRPLCEKDMKGYDPKATLEMQATRLMDQICKEFCDWVRQLGGNEQVIDEETLKDMFEINFKSDACKSTQVVIKEMPTVPLPVVKVRYCPEANELEATQKEIQQDLKVEGRPKCTFTFGRSLPRELRFVPPRKSVATKWLDCEYIPKDLENMDVVWNDIGHLDSVQEFHNFLNSKKVLRSSKLLKILEKAMKVKT